MEADKVVIGDMSAVIKQYAEQNAEPLPVRSESTGWVACHVECTIGDLGHCGRTHHEHFYHCEKLFNEKKQQRGEEQPNK